jgi:hypothetical protein
MKKRQQPTAAQLQKRRAVDREILGRLDLIPTRFLTPTELLQRRNAAKIRRQRQHDERVANLHNQVRRGEKTAAQALQEICKKKENKR